MLELIDTTPEIRVQESEYKRLLGLPADYVLEGRTRELADQAAAWYAENGKPWIYAVQTPDVELAAERLGIDGTELTSRSLQQQFREAQAHSTVVLAVSAGKECEAKAKELWQEGKPDEYFFMEMYGSAVVEHLVASASGRICAWADHQRMAALPHYSPGYSGWDISDQVKLWRLLRQDGRPFAGELEVMETGMLRPKKSLLALLGLTRHVDKVGKFSRLIPCENCSLASCQYRRAPYLHALPQFEEVRQLQPAARNGDGHAGAVVPAEAEPPQYSVNARALRKWSKERLVLKVLPDGSVESRFRYEGTTCSNLGRPLEFDYHVKLGPRQQGYRILESRCEPAPGDAGHTSMCEYLRDPDSLMLNISGEKPLLGRPLNDVLTWQRRSSPSGCYCDYEGRIHKWGLVLEVIHYALARRQDDSS
jgi:hypothetical protein